MTDYTGVSLEDIVEHLRDWKRNTDEAISLLEGHLSNVVNARDRLDGPEDIEGYIKACIDLFTRYSFDFGRLIQELPQRVEQRHIEIVNQIFRNSVNEDSTCTAFKRGHIERTLRDERLRGLLDRIYIDTRGMITDYRDLSNLAPRLRTFLGGSQPASKVSVDDVDALELKPNVLGIGLNVNYIFKRVWAFFGRRKKN